jgi:hypothetical protein
MSTPDVRVTRVIRAVQVGATISELIGWAAASASRVSMSLAPELSATPEVRGLTNAIVSAAGGEVHETDPAKTDPVWDSDSRRGSYDVEASLTAAVAETLKRFDRSTGWLTSDAPRDLRLRRADGSTALGIRSPNLPIWTELDDREMSAIPGGRVGGWVIESIAEPTLEHSRPARLARGDTLVGAPREAIPAQFERLWCKALGEGTFEVCCIPFFIFGLGLGDVIFARAVEDGSWQMTHVVEHSRSVAWVEVQSPTTMQTVRERLTRDRVAFEVQSSRELAVDVPQGPDWTSAVLEWLEYLEDVGEVSISYSG